MKPELLIVVACIGFAVGVYLAVEVLLFRLACKLTRVDPRSMLKSIAFTLITLVAVFLVEGLLGGLVERIYTGGGFPLWEAGVVGFFLGLPIHMGLVSFIHARFLRIPFSDALAVWFVDKSMKLAIGGVALGLFALLLNIQRVAA